MKKYKHSKLGFIAEPYNDGGNFYRIAHKDGTISVLKKELIESSNDWILQNSWEITAFRWVSDGDLFRLKEDGYYSDGICSYSYDSCMSGSLASVENGRIEIFSVRRDDGQEFKLGDKIKTENYPEIYTIKKFRFADDKTRMVIEADGINKDWEGNCIAIEYLQHSKVLFTTEDGVDIYDEHLLVHYVSSNMTLNTNLAKYYRPHHEGKYFNTKKAAELYISQNKPKYSLKQIETAAAKAFKYCAEDIKSVLNELEKL